MDILKKIVAWLDCRRHFIAIGHLIVILLSCFLLYKTSSLWQNIFDLFITVVKPFFIAFVIAYVFEPFVKKITQYKISRPAAIAIVITSILTIVIIFIFTLVPLLYDKSIEMLNPLSNGLGTLQSWLLEHFKLDISEVVKETTLTFQNWIVNLSFMDTTIGIVTNILNKLGSYIIYLILAIYFMADYDRIHHKIRCIAYKINSKFAYCLKQIDHQLTAYIKAFLLLMMIQTCIYSGIYFLIGHSNWILLGLLSGVSCIFPYIGPMSINILGIITALGMPMMRIILLLVAIFIQSNIDSYLITPKVYSSKIEIEPIYVIFSLLTASTLLGPWGIIIAMPSLVIIKIAYQTIKEFRHTS